jgi:hypothetical protein
VTLPWVVLDSTGTAIEPISEFLRELLACGNNPASCRSYGYDLLRWFRFLAAVGVLWSRAQRSEVRDFVLWLRTSHNPARDRSRPDAPAAGSVSSAHGPARNSTDNDIRRLQRVIIGRFTSSARRSWC